MKSSYSKKSQKIATYLIILKWLEKMNQKKFKKFKRKIFFYLIRNKHLFKKANKNISLKKIIDNENNKDLII